MCHYLDPVRLGAMISAANWSPVLWILHGDQLVTSIGDTSDQLVIDIVDTSCKLVTSVIGTGHKLVTGIVDTSDTLVTWLK